MCIRDSFQLVVQSDFLGCHGHDLDDLVLTSLLDQGLDDLVGFLGVASPVDVATALGHVLLELLKQLGHTCRNVALNGGACFAQLLPVIQLVDNVLTLHTNGRGGVLVITALGDVVKFVVRSLCLLYTSDAADEVRRV